MADTNTIWRDIFDERDTSTTAGMRQRIIAESLRQGVDPALMLALAQHESGFNARAVSPTNVTGLFQVTNDTGRGYGQTPQTRRNPDVSMQAGIGHFKQLLKETGGDTREALRRYGDPNVSNYPDLVYANYAAQAGDVPQTAQAERLRQRTQSSMQRGQSRSSRPQAPLSTDDIMRDIGLGVPVQPQGIPLQPGGEPVPAAKPRDRAQQQPEGTVRAAIQPAGAMRAGIAGIEPLTPVNLAEATEMTWEGPALREPEQPRKVDPRRMDDDALLRQIGADPALVKQSRFYRPGIFQNMLVTPESAGERLMRSPTGSVIEGARMTLAGAEQLAAHGLETAGVTSPADTAFTDAMVRLKRVEYEQTKRPTVAVPLLGDVNPPEMAGQMLVPLPGGQGILPMKQAGTFLGNTARGLVSAATAGAVAGAAQPVYQPGDTFASQKAGQVATGAIAGTALGAVPALASGALGIGRAARAVERAQQQTADDVAAHAQRQAERARTSEALASEATAQAEMATAQAHTNWLDTVNKSRQELEGALLQRKARLETAEREVLEANVAAREAYNTRGTDAYTVAVEKMRALERERQAAQAAYDDAVRQQQQAVQQVQAMPERYMPQMPARSMRDVQRDMAFLDQGGASAEAVVKRLGARDVVDASRMLADEGNTYMAAGQRLQPSPGPDVQPSWRQAQPRLEQPQAPELQTFIRSQGGIKLTDEELRGEFAGLLSPRETGTTRLLNNRSGQSAQKLAEAAAEQGYIASADKDALLGALRQSVTEGRPVYPQGMEPVAFPSTGATSGPLVPRQPRPGESVSRTLYGQLEEVAGRTPVNFGPAQDVAQAIQEQLAPVMPSMRPSRIQKITDDLLQAGSQGSFAQAHQALKDLGPLTRSDDGKLRGMAKQLVQGIHESLNQSAMEFPEVSGARQLLRQANAAYRQELAVGDLRRILAPGGTVLKYERGQLVLKPDALQNQVERLIQRDPFFAGSFEPAQLQALRADVAQYAGTPSIPRTRPEAPDAAPLPGLVDVSKIGERPTPQTIWDLPESQRRDLRPVTIPEVPPHPAPVEPKSVRATPWEPPPAPRDPEVIPPWRLWMTPERAIPVGIAAAKGIGLAPALAVGGAADLASYGLAKALLTPAGRPLLDRIMANGGVISPEIQAILGRFAATAYQQAPSRTEPGSSIDQMQERARQRLKQSMGLEETDRPNPISGNVR